MKYHISKTGDPKRCKAAEGNCPLGADSPHFNNQKEARTHYETIMNSKTSIKNNQKVPIQKTTLQDNNNYDKIMNMKNKTETFKYWVNLVNTPKPSVVLRKLSKTPLEKELLPELHALHDVPQCSTWHPEGDVYEHSLQAMDVAQTLSKDLSQEDKNVVVLAALCHDFGKVTNTQIHDDGKITSYEHDDAGVAPVGEFLSRIGAPQSTIEAVQALVKNHMIHVNPMSKSTVRRLKKNLSGSGATVNQLALLIESDTGGRGAASHSGIGEKLLEIEKEVIEYDKKREPQSKMTGKFLISLGLKPSPAFKSIIKEYIDSGLDLSDKDRATWVLSRISETNQ